MLPTPGILYKKNHNNFCLDAIRIPGSVLVEIRFLWLKVSAWMFVPNIIDYCRPWDWAGHIIQKQRAGWGSLTRQVTGKPLPTILSFLMWFHRKLTSVFHYAERTTAVFLWALAGIRATLLGCLHSPSPSVALRGLCSCFSCSELASGTTEHGEVAPWVLLRSYFLFLWCGCPCFLFEGPVFQTG